MKKIKYWCPNCGPLRLRNQHYPQCPECGVAMEEAVEPKPTRGHRRLKCTDMGRAFRR